jgi:hypothetical protein
MSQIFTTNRSRTKLCQQVFVVRGELMI